MGQPRSTVCSPWATHDDVCAPYDALDDDLLDEWIEVASQLLFEFTGRRYPGLCTTTVRPCARSLAAQPVRDRTGRVGSWAEVCTCNAGRRCGCGPFSEITLGAQPVVSVDEVKVDGVVLDASEYRVDDHRWLVRLSCVAGEYQDEYDDVYGTGVACPGWPCCQNMLLTDDSEDTFSVTFTYGREPPAAGVKAAAEYGGELALACQADAENCRLPSRVTSITRQGVTAVMLDPFAMLDEGKTGLYLVDAFIRASNPSKLARRAGVISPDVGRRVRRTGT